MYGTLDPAEQVDRATAVGDCRSSCAETLQRFLTNLCLVPCLEFYASGAKTANFRREMDVLALYILTLHSTAEGVTRNTGAADAGCRAKQAKMLGKVKILWIVRC